MDFSLLVHNQAVGNHGNVLLHFSSDSVGEKKKKKKRKKEKSGQINIIFRITQHSSVETLFRASRDNWKLNSHHHQNVDRFVCCGIMALLAGRSVSGFYLQAMGASSLPAKLEAFP